MKHRQTGRKFGRVRKQRKALLKSLLGNLILHEKINTTEAKAKEIKPLIDVLINKAKKAQETKEKKVTIIRNLNTKLPVNAVEKLIGEFVNEFSERNSGYSRIIKLDSRQSDSAKMAIIELIKK